MKRFILLFITSIAFSISVQAQNVNIPDANFKAFLTGNTSINTNGDSEIQVSEASAYTGGIDCAGLSISDLTGIEAFPDISQLRCQSNSLNSLDVSQNTALTYLDCGFNLLSNIDVSQNTALLNFTCRGNPLSNLDVSQNIALSGLNCSSSSLTSLDVSQNISLRTLTCWNNALTSLDVTQNPLLLSLACYENSLTSLDVTQNPELDNFTCNDNALSSLDVTQNPALIILYCDNNNLSSLNLNQNTALIALYCFNNSITSLDLSQNIELTTLDCGDNSLNDLNVANGNNTNLLYYNFNTINNPNLSCIQVDDVTYSTTNWTPYVDATSSFATDCTATVSIINVEGATFKGLNAYPNPTRDILNLKIDEELTSIRLINLMGQTVREFDTNSTQLHLSDLSTGVYLLELASTNKRAVVKVTKE